MNPAHIVVDKVQAGHGLMVCDLLAECVSQAGVSQHPHAHCEIFTLNIACAYVLRIGVADASVGLGSNTPAGAVASARTLVLEPWIIADPVRLDRRRWAMLVKRIYQADPPPCASAYDGCTNVQRRGKKKMMNEEGRMLNEEKKFTKQDNSPGLLVAMLAKRLGQQSDQVARG